jgi:osmotically inducible protein OsmC
MDRKASATWRGGLKDGNGILTAPSTVLNNTPYSFRTRFENEPGTNPEELIAAAHAGCFSMALSAELGGAGMTPERIDTTATVTMEPVDGKPTITKIHLVCRAKVPGADAAKFNQVAEGAKAGCPVSRVLNAKITLDAKLESELAAD